MVNITASAGFQKKGKKYLRKSAMFRTKYKAMYMFISEPVQNLQVHLILLKNVNEMLHFLCPFLSFLNPLETNSFYPQHGGVFFVYARHDFLFCGWLLLLNSWHRENTMILHYVTQLVSPGKLSRVFHSSLVKLPLYVTSKHSGS